MKTAHTTQGQPVEASESAPKTAVCPICGGNMTLRSRRTMNNGQRAYFWRHGRNQNQQCYGRRRPT